MLINKKPIEEDIFSDLKIIPNNIKKNENNNQNFKKNEDNFGINIIVTSIISSIISKAIESNEKNLELASPSSTLTFNPEKRNKNK